MSIAVCVTWFAGKDWVVNLGADLVELMDTGLDNVRLVIACPNTTSLEELLASGKTHRIASEYQKITEDWIKISNLNAQCVRVFGATESFPPDDADILFLDNTHRIHFGGANGLSIAHKVMSSSTDVVIL